MERRIFKRAALRYRSLSLSRLRNVLLNEIPNCVPRISSKTLMRELASMDLKRFFAAVKCCWQHPKRRGVVILAHYHSPRNETLWTTAIFSDEKIFRGENNSFHAVGHSENGREAQSCVPADRPEASCAGSCLGRHRLERRRAVKACARQSECRCISKPDFGRH